MEDLVQVLIFLGILVFSLLAGGKKKAAQARRPPPPRPRPPSATEGAAQAEPQELVEGLMDLLRGRIPIEVPREAPRTPVAAPLDDEAVSLEVLEPDRRVEHEEFHEKYVAGAVPATVTRGPRSRYRLTPRTAREAVIWTAIFSRPKGME